MRKKLITAFAVVIAAFLLVTNPVVADAAKLITGAQIKNNSVTGKDVREGSLAAVPKANGLTPLKSGQTQSGAFSAAAGDSSAGYLGFAVNFPRPLNTAIDDDNIVDTVANPDPVNCPGAGQAAPGYLCLYSNARNGIDYIYGYSEGTPYADLSKSVGIGLYAVVDGATPYVDGVWTVTAP
jgi:hypothetical protein